MRFINRNSFIIGGSFVVLALGIVLLRDGLQAGDVIAMAFLMAGLTLAFILLRPGAGMQNEADQVLARIGAGRPVLLQFQSNF